MKKPPAYRLLFGASILMVLGFGIHLAVDYHQYCVTLNSAPFWVWVLVDGLLWLIPAGLAAAAGWFAWKKSKRKEK